MSLEEEFQLLETIYKRLMVVKRFPEDAPNIEDWLKKKKRPQTWRSICEFKSVKLDPDYELNNS